ncbi:unnamed protein product [Rotaria sp. Silwood2]|nr:unnamed protein product [Rotaria sp. Silwood2]CAF3159114.1 unnamed protein product [Rotaria sp. Silwood2]CAF4268308.1 unnamed protein product [Rotaria sp. Silwood2]CAF4344568.1 unnamed protein product [Rotaria sp. Silwood2]
MDRRILLLLLMLCICFKIINSKSQCSCSCCKGNRCMQRYQGSISLPTCSAKSCKSACKMRYPGQCSGSPGTIAATCTKTRKPRLASYGKKSRSVFRTSSRKHTIRRHKIRPSSKKILFRRPTKVRTSKKHLFGRPSKKHSYRRPY